MRRGSKEQRGMRSGCLNVALMLLVASVATALTVAGVVLFLSFAALTFESPTGIEEILKMVVALIAAYFFVRVGRGVWRDLRGHHQEVEPGGSEREERGPAGGGGR